MSISPLPVFALIPLCFALVAADSAAEEITLSQAYQLALEHAPDVDIARLESVLKLKGPNGEAASQICALASGQKIKSANSLIRFLRPRLSRSTVRCFGWTVDARRFRWY